MKVTKAIITAAGKNQRTLPLQTLVDRDRETKSALAILIGETLSAGIEEIAVVIAPGEELAYAAAVSPHQKRVRFIEQPEPAGYGHAVHCGADFVGDEPFLLMVGDHLHVSHTNRTCAAQLIETAEKHGCAVSAVQATHESKLPYYGAVGGRLVTGREGLYEIDTVLEKPTPTVAEQKIVVPGLRAGNYLCFFGMHIFPSRLMEILARQLAAGRADLPQALGELARGEKFLALEVQGKRHDIGLPYGLFNAQLALAMAGPDRAEVLRQIVETMAQAESRD